MFEHNRSKSLSPSRLVSENDFFMPGWYSRPLSATLCLTNECNLSCKHCAPSSGRKLDREMDRSSWVAIVDHLVKNGVFSFTCTGGEPFLSRAMPDVIKRLVMHKRRFNINTNATAIRRDVLSIIEEAGHLFSGFTISLDGGSEKAHDSLRGKGAFSGMLQGVDAIRSKGFPFKFFCVVNQHNKDEIADIAETAKSLGAYRLDLNAFGAIGRGCSFVHELSLLPEQQVDVTRGTRRLMEGYGRFIAGFYHHTVKSTIKRERFVKEHEQRIYAEPEKPGTLQACGGLREGCSILPDGTVIPCQSMNGYVIGSLMEESITQIWKNSFKAAYFRSLAGLPVTVSEECECCPYHSLCNGGCRAMAYGATGSFLSRDPFCFYPARDYAPIWNDL